MSPDRTGVVRAAFLSVALLVCGCATLDEGQCRHTDWFVLGQQEGAQGFPESRIEEHHKACGEYGLAPDDAAWRGGRAQGLATFCTADSGYRVGRRGGYYAHVCPAGTEAEFLSAFNLGRETYDVEQEIKDLNRRIESLQRRLSESTDLPADTGRDIRRELSGLYREMEWLRRSRDRLETERFRRYQSPDTVDNHSH